MGRRNAVTSCVRRGCGAPRVAGAPAVTGGRPQSCGSGPARISARPRPGDRHRACATAAVTAATHCARCLCARPLHVAHVTHACKHACTCMHACVCACVGRRRRMRAVELPARACEPSHPGCLPCTVARRPPAALQTCCCSISDLFLQRRQLLGEAAGRRAPCGRLGAERAQVLHDGLHACGTCATLSHAPRLRSASTLSSADESLSSGLRF